MTPPPFLDGRKGGRKSCTLNPKTSVWSVIMWHSRLQISSNTPFFSKITNCWVLNGSVKGIFKPSVGFGKEEIPVSPHNQSFPLRWETAGSGLKKGIFHNLEVLQERTGLKQDFCTNIRGRESRKEKFTLWLERQTSKIQRRARREDWKQLFYAKKGFQVKLGCSISWPGLGHPAALGSHTIFHSQNAT